MYRRLGRRIRALREDRQLTQEELAERVGIHPTSVAKLESGQRQPSLDTLQGLASAMCVTPSDIVSALDGDPKPYVRANDLLQEIVHLLEQCDSQQLRFIRSFVHLLQDYDASMGVTGADMVHDPGPNT